MDENHYEIPLQNYGYANAGHAKVEVRSSVRGLATPSKNDVYPRRDEKTKSCWRVISAILVLLIVVAVIALFVMYFQLRTKLDKTDQDRFGLMQEVLRLNQSGRERELRLLTAVYENANRTSGVLQSVRNLEQLFSKLRGWQLTKQNLAFKKFSKLVDYATAETECGKYESGRLASIALRDPSIVKHMIAKGYGKSHCWIGLTDRQQEGTWIWADGGTKNVMTTAWNSGEPNSYNEKEEDCGEVVGQSGGRTLLMNDEPCSEKHQYICEIVI